MPQVSVGTSATLISTAPTDLVNGQSIRVKLKSSASASVFLGRTSSVTSSSTNIGYELEAGEILTWQLQAAETLYGIVASGTQTVHTLEAGI